MYHPPVEVKWFDYISNICALTIKLKSTNSNQIIMHTKTNLQPRGGKAMVFISDGRGKFVLSTDNPTITLLN